MAGAVAGVEPVRWSGRARDCADAPVRAGSTEEPAPGSDGSWGSVEAAGEDACNLVVTSDLDDADQGPANAERGEAADLKGVAGHGATAGGAAILTLIMRRGVFVLDSIKIVDSQCVRVAVLRVGGQAMIVVNRCTRLKHGDGEDGHAHRQ